MDFDLCSDLFLPQPLNLDYWKNHRDLIVGLIYFNPEIFFQYLWNPKSIIPHDPSCCFVFNQPSLKEKILHPIIGPRSFHNQIFICLFCQRLQKLSNYRLSKRNPVITTPLGTTPLGEVKIIRLPFSPHVSQDISSDYPSKKIFSLDKETNQFLISWIASQFIQQFILINHFVYRCRDEIVMIEENIPNMENHFDIWWKEIIIQLFIIASLFQKLKIIHGDLSFQVFHPFPNHDTIFWGKKQYYPPFLLKLEFTGKSTIEIGDNIIVKPFYHLKKTNEKDYSRQLVEMILIFLNLPDFRSAFFGENFGLEIWKKMWIRSESPTLPFPNLDQFNHQFISDINTLSPPQF